MAANFRPISRDRHANKKWLAPRDLSFAADRHLVPIVLAEVGAAARALPMAFVRSETGPVLVGVLGLEQSRSLMVTGQGSWVGLYMPAILRSHPFKLAKAEGEKLVLCVDETSGLVVDGASQEGNAFFDAQGQIDPATAKIMEFVSTIQQGEQAAAAAVRVLDEVNLLEDWPIKIGEGPDAREVAGLLRINETVLNGLDAENLLRIRQGGGLALAYAQLISMGNLQLLGALLSQRPSSQPQEQQAKAAEKDFLSEQDGSLKIDWNTFLKN